MTSYQSRFHESAFGFAAQLSLEATEKGSPIFMSWSTRVPEFDHVKLWDRARGLTGNAFLWISTWGGPRIVTAGSAVGIGGTGSGRFADVRQAWSEITSILRQNCDLAHAPGPVLVGGFAFSPEVPDSMGAGSFPDGLMTVPAVQFISLPCGDNYVTVNLLIRPAADFSQVLASRLQLLEDLMNLEELHNESRAASSGVLSKIEIPSGLEFQRLVERAVGEIRAGTFEMIVPVRELKVTVDGEFDLSAAVQRLLVNSPNTTVFASHLMGEGSGKCFLGATPEYLVRLTGGTVRTLGLAGSIPRGTVPEQDSVLESQLMADQKLRRENSVVTEMLRQVLSGVCSKIEVENEPKVLKLAQIQHLATEVCGMLDRPSDVGIFDLVAMLHPTPALGGHPRREALNWLKDNESIERGWFAGPVGWVQSDGSGEFGVAIRSAFVRNSEASLYAGCGIVEGSEPRAEYEETQVKLLAMAAALGCL
ncbi:isochorismate synthase MenF [Streptomyces bikiniensis]|uniref:isochorismate synthase n=1 Tax=Streptomyces bikiniensis TaxID=1896 RepID=A0ABW8D1B0_STRBI